MGHGRNNVFRISIQNEISRAIIEASDNYGFERAELKGKILALESSNARLRGILKSVLDHVEDSEITRAGNECTLCKTYRDMIRAALEGKP